MLGRYFKIFLPVIFSIFAVPFLVGSTSLVFADDSNGYQNNVGYGSITVCKVIIDENGNIVDGSTKAGTQFSISGITPTQTSEASPIGQFGTANFTSPLSFNDDVINDGGNDSECITFEGLEIGGYYYGEESVNPPNGWATPKYNDQFTVDVNTINDFFSYDANLFDGNPANDSSRNKNVDGHIVLTEARPNRTLVVLNQLTTQPAVGGGPSIGGGRGGPQCPTDRPQQVDQVWFTDIKPGEVTVHWANKGDAWGFHIAYGPSKDNLIWGVEVDDSKANQFTLKGLPDGELWVSVIAKSSKECGGPVSEPRVTGQVLAAAGIASSTLLSLAGAGIILLGLWQAQRGLRRSGKKS